MLYSMGNATDNITGVTSGISNCSLIINNEAASFKDTITDSEVFNFTYFLNNGAYNWEYLLLR
ncbi:MAG: hypothetical protein KatS3mg002_1237 [Candidatus Woesearchaeota archaeon]|nr:MAG: hypothetical protein KatS3mg002_1237 [Candidatus Woesearchaeota archaeon]